MTLLRPFRCGGLREVVHVRDRKGGCIHNYCSVLLLLVRGVEQRVIRTSSVRSYRTNGRRLISSPFKNI